MTDHRDEDPSVGAPRAIPREHDEALAALIASTDRCVANAMKWGLRDVGALRVLLTSDATCVALHECVSHYARMLRNAGQSAEQTATIVVEAVDLGSAEVAVQVSLRNAVREWALEAWEEGSPRVTSAATAAASDDRSPR